MVARHSNGHFQKGTGGRPPGTRNKLQAKVFESLLQEWESHGGEVLRIVRMEKPDVWLKVVAGILPKEFQHGPSAVDELTEEETVAALETIRAMRGKAA